MNNSGAIYIECGDAGAVAAVVRRHMAGMGLHEAQRAPDDLCGRIMLPDKPVRHFFVAPPTGGWVALWEDPRYFAERALARRLAHELDTRAVWIEVSGNGVCWGRGLYLGDSVVEECYDEMRTTFYGEYGTISFAFDIEALPDEFIARLGLPHADLHYEAVLMGALPPAAGAPLHLVFEKAGRQ